MDWRLFHGIYDVSLHHHWVGSFFNGVEKASIPVMIIATAALWLFARPGGDRKWKFAAGSALGAAALGLLVNRIISGVIWHRDRPFVTHHVAHIWGPRKTDASFPSDHSTAAFAIAAAVVMLDPVAGAVFLVLAVLIAIGRVIVGEHYPGDALMGAAVGTVAALVVVRLGRPVIAFFVRLIERVTDPLLRPAWRGRTTGR